MAKYNKETYHKDKQEELKQIMKNLEEGVKNVFTSEKYLDYLDVMSKFHRYSSNNILMIMLQMPEAQYVAGYTTWKQLERNVKKGEKGIKILAPCKYTVEVGLVDAKSKEPILDENGKQKIEKRDKIGFKTAAVFDISQTEGKELPELVTELKGTVEEKHTIYRALEELTGIRIQEEDIKGGAKGYFQHSTLQGEKGKIVVQRGMEDLQSVKTAIHESAHCLLHDTGAIQENASRDKKEVQAESVAYVICKKLGLDTSDYSFAYVASWSSGKEVSELRESLDIIQETVQKIYNKIDKKLEHIQDLDKHIDKTVKDEDRCKIINLNKEIARGGR